MTRGKEEQWITQPPSILRQAWSASSMCKTQEFLIAIWESASRDRTYSKRRAGHHTTTCWTSVLACLTL